MTARFRETLWFKKGASLASEPAATDAEAAAAPSLGELPLDDRYLDDGSVTTADTASFGIHTGVTAPLPVVVKIRKKK